jgi:hypothetical protein
LIILLRIIDGGVPGGTTFDVNLLEGGCAGEGEVARNKSKSAPSSPVPATGLRRNAEGGVDGGEEFSFTVVL